MKLQLLRNTILGLGVSPLPAESAARATEPAEGGEPGASCCRAADRSIGRENDRGREGRTPALLIRKALRGA
jgi:hypothetical protein